MSHQATNWAMQQRDMKPATKTVLLCLADRHNPEKGCFPSHKRIAADACMSERSVRNHLATLEAMGLLRRVKGTGGRIKRAATRYVFAFEDGFDAVPRPAERRPITESRRQKRPESRRQILPANPVKEPQKEEGAREARVSDDLFEGVKRAVGFGPNAILPSWWRGEAARDHVRRWKDQFGLTDAEILETAAATRKQHPIPPDGPKALDRAMERRGRAKQAENGTHRRRRSSKRPSAPPVAKHSETEVLRKWADWVNGDGFLAPSALSNTLAYRLVSSGLVAPERFRQRGLGHLLPEGALGSRRDAVA